MDSKTECASLRLSVAEMQEKLASSEGDRDNLNKMTQQLSSELEELKASMESSKHCCDHRIRNTDQHPYFSQGS